jgi:hypothetical protein
VEMDKFIFVHIPKTAGGTFRRILDANFENTIRDISKPWGGLEATCGRYEKFNIIHGHFHADKYEHLGRPLVTFLREPTVRLVSDYYFFGEQYHPGLDIIEYAQVRANIQAEYIQDIDKFDFVGLTEKFTESLNMFEKWSSVKIPRNFENYNVSKKKKDVTKDEIKHIMKYQEKDYEIYNKILEYHSRRCK